MQINGKTSSHNLYQFLDISLQMEIIAMSVFFLETSQLYPQDAECQERKHMTILAFLVQLCQWGSKLESPAQNRCSTNWAMKAIKLFNHLVFIVFPSNGDLELQVYWLMIKNFYLQVSCTRRNNWEITKVKLKSLRKHTLYKINND